MAKYKLLLPRMGESVSEATVVKWLKQPGDSIEIDDSVLDIATDKVDSEVPSPVSGTLLEQLYKENDIALVGEAVAIIEVDEEVLEQEPVYKEPSTSKPIEDNVETHADIPVPGIDLLKDKKEEPVNTDSSYRFYSPLVKNIAAEEGIQLEELDKIKGSGLEGRVTKQDILNYVVSKARNSTSSPISNSKISNTDTEDIAHTQLSPAAEGDEIIEMDRMRKLIADHMLASVQTSPHVCSFIEADVTNIVNWRERVKNTFEKQEGTKITFTPIFIEAIAKAIRDYPMINISVNGSQIIKKRDINIGMATALPSGNLIVPVIRNADQLNLVGITKVVNDMAVRARTNKLKPDETQGGTFTVTNVGSFGTIMGTPIINQPQVAILALGAIVKKPAVLETDQGDVIAIRQRMFLSLSYDHRVVDGALGGMFLKRIVEYLENWDVKRES